MELGPQYGDPPYLTEVQWQSQEQVLEGFLGLHGEIWELMGKKGKIKKILCDIMSHLYVLNLQLGGGAVSSITVYATGF